MANSRIKDITTTATTPADDDYLVIDGETNGTRKISASGVGGDKMYDRTLNSGNTLTVSANSSATRILYCDVSSLTNEDLAKVKVYGVAPAPNNTRYFSYTNNFSVSSSFVTIVFYNLTSSSVTATFHVLSPFEITNDTASM